MRAVITDVIFRNEFESKFGTMYAFEIHYDKKKAKYTSKNKDQKNFIKGQEAEFIEETKTFVKKNGETQEYLAIKPPLKPFQKQSNFGKAMTKEKSKYSGFAVSYAKDLVVAGRLDRDELVTYAWVLFEAMAEMDKSLEL